MSAITEKQIVAELKEWTLRTTQAYVADRLNLSPAFICDVLKGRREVTERLAKKLGYRRVVQFERVK